MYEFLTKNGQVIAFGVGVLLIVIFFAIALPGAGNYTFETMSGTEKAEVTIFDFGLISSIILAVIAALAMLAFGVLHMFSDLKGSLQGLLGLAAMVAIFVISYVTASSEPESPQLAAAVQKFGESGVGVITPGNLKFIGASITMSLIMTVIAVGALAVTGIRNIFK